MKIDSVTKHWIRNPSDEQAAENGCRFDVSRGKHICEFIERELVLYEGDLAGQPFRLIAWQRDLLMRAFGWVRFDRELVKPRWVRRFRKVSVWVPKKNGKSPLAAAVGLYLLTADGEPGAKVYSAAKDGKQAQIVHNHARQMVLRSPSLNAACRINKSTGQISFPHTTAVYSILSGDNIAGQEGLNGSVVIDETHVVDDRLAKVLEHMGASRSEPMQFEVSTAGNNPEGYGRRQFDYGRQVEAGDIRDDEFLFVGYYLPADAADDDCLHLSTWKRVNPSWGVTIRPTEFRKSLERARQRSLADWASFKMYRLNQWQAGACPWLADGDWRACAADFDTTDLAGLPAAAGLDLSKTRDMSALALCWAEDDAWSLAVWLWITERYAERNSSKAPFAEWAAAGDLVIIPGDTIRQSWIREQFDQLAEQHLIDVLVYDRTYAQDFVEYVDETRDCQLVEFPQSAQLMEKPVDDFQAAVREKKLRHRNNRCLNWQAGHCEVKPNAKGHRILAKPGPNDVRKIDGLVAAVMACWGTAHVSYSQSADLFLM